MISSARYWYSPTRVSHSGAEASPTSNSSMGNGSEGGARAGGHGRGAEQRVLDSGKYTFYYFNMQEYMF